MTVKDTGSGPTGPAPDNPMGTDGFEFVEVAALDPGALRQLFDTLGFVPVARHRSKDVLLYRQGDIHFVVNAEPDGFSRRFARAHGPSICAIALRVRDARQAYERALSLGATAHHGPVGPMELSIPAIEGIGGSAIYLVDRYGDRTIYDVDFVPIEAHGARAERGVGLVRIDHLTHNVERGHLERWVGFYERLFGFREQRFFDIRGQHTGLRSRALISPCGKVRIPINESADDRSQIEEYLRAYGGEGIQHLALQTDDIFASVAALRARGVRFLSTPSAYYELLARRLPGHGVDLTRLAEHQVLLDGAPPRLLLQIFTETLIGPIFFELIERRGDEGFGEGNFQALFEAMELEQIRRGELSV